MSEGISSVLSVLGCFPKFVFDANLLFIINEQELTTIKNLLISASLVARQSIGTFNPCN